MREAGRTGQRGFAKNNRRGPRLRETAIVLGKGMLLCQTGIAQGRLWNQLVLVSLQRLPSPSPVKRPVRADAPPP
ncbi:hypothetical protein NBRC116593_10010 [Sulfitobacter pacificus]